MTKCGNVENTSVKLGGCSLRNCVAIPSTQGVSGSCQVTQFTSSLGSETSQLGNIVLGFNLQAEGPSIVSSAFTTDTYLDVSTAQQFFDLRLNADAWNNATVQQQTAALYQATKIIDRLNYAGVRLVDYQTSVLGHATVSQVLEFPRVTIQTADPINNPPTTPEDILIACCLIALALLDGVDPEIELQNIGTLHQGFAALRETYDPTVIREAFRAGVPSVEAWGYLIPYLEDPRAIRLRRA